MGLSDRVKELESRYNIVSRLFKKTKKRVDEQVRLMETFRRNLTPMEVILGRAGIVTRYSYRFDFDLASGSQDTQPDTVTITPDTIFLKQRLTAHWLPSAGTGQDRWWPVASSNPAVAVAVHGGAAMEIPDFFYEVKDVKSGRVLSDKPIPGDWLYRQDRDGFLTDYPSVFQGKNQITVTVSLTRNAPQDGTLYLMMHGVQSVFEPKDAVTFGS